MTPYNEASAYFLTNLETVFSYLLPEGKREGNNYVVGNIAGQPPLAQCLDLHPCFFSDHRGQDQYPPELRLFVAGAANALHAGQFPGSVPARERDARLIGQFKRGVSIDV
jgi:hypothetical protein